MMPCECVNRYEYFIIINFILVEFFEEKRLNEISENNLYSLRK